MSVKERLHHLIEELSDTDLLVAERMLRGLKIPSEEPPAASRRPTPEERQESLDRLRALMKGRVSTETYLREKHEEIEREEEQLRERQGRGLR